MREEDAYRGCGCGEDCAVGKFLILVDDELEKERREKGRKSERSEQERTNERRKEGKEEGTLYITRF